MLLSNNRNSFILYEWLLGYETKIHFYSGKINIKQLKNMNPEYIVSYNYNYIVTGEIIKQFSGRIYNLHTSYLPWNRGFSPNFWSFIDNTSKGVTIHEMSEGLDTGKIIVQKELFFDEGEESFKSSYEKLNQEILGLFQENWQLIKAGKMPGREQEQNVGSYHSKKDLIEFTKEITLDWSLGIKEIKMMLGIE